MLHNKRAVRSLSLVAALSAAPALAQEPPRTAAAPPTGAPSICDSNCVRANMDKAARACARPIEAQAPIDYEWISRPFSGIFDEADPSSADNAIVPYRGDGIRYLTPQKEWIRVVYECAFDTSAQKIVRLNVRPGRLGMPAQQAAAPGPQGPGPGTPKIRADLLAQAIAKAAAQNQRKPPRSPKTVSFGEPSSIEVEQVRR